MNICSKTLFVCPSWVFFTFFFFNFINISFSSNIKQICYLWKWSSFFISVNFTKKPGLTTYLKLIFYDLIQRRERHRCCFDPILPCTWQSTLWLQDLCHGSPYGVWLCIAPVFGPKHYRYSNYFCRAPKLVACLTSLIIIQCWVVIYTHNTPNNERMCYARVADNSWLSSPDILQCKSIIIR